MCPPPQAASGAPKPRFWRAAASIVTGCPMRARQLMRAQRAQQLLAEVARRDRPLLHELEVEALRRVSRTELELCAAPQREDLLLARAVGDRLRRPARVAR